MLTSIEEVFGLDTDEIEHVVKVEPLPFSDQHFDISKKFTVLYKFYKQTGNFLGDEYYLCDGFYIIKKDDYSLCYCDYIIRHGSYNVEELVEFLESKNYKLS